MPERHGGAGDVGAATVRTLVAHTALEAQLAPGRCGNEVRDGAQPTDIDRAPVGAHGKAVRALKLVARTGEVGTPARALGAQTAVPAEVSVSRGGEEVRDRIRLVGGDGDGGAVGAHRNRSQAGQRSSRHVDATGRAIAVAGLERDLPTRSEAELRD